MQDLTSRRAAIDVTWEEPSYTDALNILTEVRDKIRALPTVVEPQMDLIDTTGLDEQIRCEMCKNPMHTDRGCDGNCKYDEKLYEKIMQILDKRITPLPSAQPEIVRCKDCKHWRRQTNYQGSPLSFGFCESDDMWRSLYGETCEVEHIDTDDDHYCGYAERKDDE